jgi:hypothetical protein
VFRTARESNYRLILWSSERSQSERYSGNPETSDEPDKRVACVSLHSSLMLYDVENPASMPTSATSPAYVVDLPILGFDHSFAPIAKTPKNVRQDHQCMLGQVWARKL